MNHQRDVSVSKKIKSSIFVALAATVFVFGGAHTAFATVSVTLATGGSAISADTTDGAFTPLIGPIVSEGATADIGTGTIVVNAPSGFLFDTGGVAPTVLVTRIAGNGANNRNINDLASGSTIAVTRTSSTLTIAITAATSNGVRNSLTWQNVRVRPSAGTPLASGNIVKTGTASIVGVTNNVTNFGTLTEVVGAKNKVTILTQPSFSTTAGTDFTIKPTVALQDQFGNTVTNDSASTIERSAVLSTQLCGGVAGSGTFSSTPASGVSVTSGVLTYSAMQYTAREDIKICFTSSGVTSALSNVVSVAAGPTASFSLSNPGDMYAKTRLGYTVTRYDSFGNAVGTGTTTVYLYSSSTSDTKKFYDDSLAGSIVTSIDITPGHSTANFWYYDEAPGTYTITTSDNASAPDGATGVADANDSVVVNPVATKFVILQPSNGTVDSSITVTVQAQKPDDSVDTNYQGDVTLVTSGSATGGGLVDIINGVGTKNVSDTVAEMVNLSLTDSESTGLDVSSTQFAVFAGGALSQFSLSHPGTLIAGQRAAYTVTRKDQYGNLSTLATTTVHLYSSSTGTNKNFYDAASAGTTITSVSIPDGQSSTTFWYYDELPGTWSITASDNSGAPDGNVGINDSVDSLQVTAGPVATFLIDNPGDMTAGTRLGYTITRKDQFSNLVTSGATMAYLYTTSTGAGAATFYAAASGGSPITNISIPDGQSSEQIWYFDENTGTWDVMVSDNASAPDGAIGVADASDSVNVIAAPIVATRFVIVPPTNGTVDAAIVITVQAEDADGNIDTTQNTGVTLTANGSATGAGLVTITNGVGTLSISDAVAQTVSLGLTDSQSTGLDVSSTRSVTFAPGAVAQFTLDNPGDVAAGTRIAYSVTRKDQFGNSVTAGATTAYLYNSSTGVNKRFYDAASGGSAITSIVIPNSTSSVGFWVYDEKAGDWIITASDNATVADGATGVADASDALMVQPAGVAKFLLDDPGNMTAATRLGYTVTRKDQFDNLVTTGVTLAYLFSSSTGTTTAFYATASGGAPTTFATINDGSSSGTFWYYDQTPGTWLVTVSDSATVPDGATGLQDAVDQVIVSAIPIVASRFVIAQPNSVQVGTPATITVEAQDADGNIDTTYQTGVTLLVSGGATGAGLVTLVNGVGTKILQDTLAETVTLSLSDTESTGLDVSSTRELTFSAAPVSGAGSVSSSAIPRITGVQLSGLAFPRAQIKILAVSSQGSSVQAQATAAADGSFKALLSNVGIGAGAYGLVGVDTFGRTTQTRVFNANVADRDSLLALDAVLLSPTLGLVHPSVRKGDMVGFVGQGVPGYTVRAQIDGSTVSQTAKVAADGSYKMLFNTRNLDLGSHAVRVQQVSPTGVRSEYAPQKVFTVTSLFTPQTDFNQDGAINVQDWSIFLSRWSSTNQATRLLDDLNGDRKIDVTDLSIFVRTLKR